MRYTLGQRFYFFSDISRSFSKDLHLFTIIIFKSGWIGGYWLCLLSSARITLLPLVCEVKDLPFFWGAPFWDHGISTSLLLWCNIFLSSKSKPILTLSRRGVLGLL